MLGALDEPIPIPWTHFHDLTAPRQEHEKCMKHASAAEAKVAKAAEGQPPPVLRQRTSELETELLRRKQAKEAAASEDAASLSSLPDAEHDAAQPTADAEGARAGRGKRRAAEASGAVQAPLQDSNTWAPTHRARLKAPHADTPFSRVGTGCRGRGGRAAKEDQAEGAVGEKAHVIALLRAGVPRGDIAGVAARRDLRHGAGALGRARALAAGRGGGTARYKHYLLLTVYSLLNRNVCLVLCC